MSGELFDGEVRARLRGANNKLSARTENKEGQAE